jgi:regulator of protease activity HflC (stomatin/prohibitin superfamily)
MKRVLNLFMVLFVALTMTSCTFDNIEMTEEGFMFRPWTDGMDTTMVYTGTVETVAMWNQMITTDVSQKSRNYTSSILDVNGTEITVVVSINYNAMKGSTPFLYKAHKLNWEESIVDIKVKGAIKNVIGRYTYEEVYSTKRESLEQEITDILQPAFASNFITYNFCEIADVNLPPTIAKEIENKETQKQRNLTSAEKKIENKNLADAKIATANGDATSRKIKADAEAYEYKMKQKNLTDKMIQQQFIEKWDGVLPQYGEVPQLFKTVSNK